MENNPLRQYFRRPAVYIKLPSNGKGYSPEVLDMPESGELPVFPMTAIDEISARTPDALFNGTAVADLIKSCIPNIKDPWSIKSFDLDAVLLGIKAASGNDTLDIDTTCPKCETSSEYGIGLVGILSTLKPGEYETPLEVGELKIKFRPLDYKEMNQAAVAQFEVQQFFETVNTITDDTERNSKTKEILEKITFMTMELISQSIEYVQTPNTRVEETPYLLDFLKNCDRTTFMQVRDHSTKLRESSELKPLNVTCNSCGHEYEQPFVINPTDFFG
jgi:hypothetical protein